MSFGGFWHPIAIFFYLCLSLYSSLQFVLFTVARHRLGPGIVGLSAPVIWVALEFLYPNLFPWRMANSQMLVTPLLQIGDVTGPFGLSFVIVWASSAMLELLRPQRCALPLALVLSSLLLILVYGQFRLDEVGEAMDRAPRLAVSLVQGQHQHRREGRYSLLRYEPWKVSGVVATASKRDGVNYLAGNGFTTLDSERYESSLAKREPFSTTRSISDFRRSVLSDHRSAASR